VDPLLERDRELTALTGALGEAQDGRGRLVVVEAPAGLGKTRLLGAAYEAAADAGFTCLRARASDLERDFAFGCVRQLLEPLIARVSDEERERVFAGAAALSTCLFAPDVAPAKAASPDSAFSMLHGLYWLINNIADEGPVALCVDDLHWTDSESLRFLNFLAPRLDGLPLAILATTRPGERDAGELARLTAAPETRVLRPEPLSAEATAALCRRRLGPEVSAEFTAACREATGGNPFLLEALLREAAEQNFATDAAGAGRVQCIGPAAVAQAVVLRLSGKPPTATALVRALSVLGDGASLTEAADLAELSVAEAARATDLLVELAILGPGSGLEFVHSIVREAIYADIGSRERARAHARAAEVLSAGGASNERIAAQIVQAEPNADPARVEFLRRVAADALGRGAPSAAVAWLRRALAEPPPAEVRGEVLLELSSAELRLGTPEAAIDRLTTAAELVRSPGLVAASVRLLAGALTWSGDADRAVVAIDHAIATLEDRDRELTLLLEAERAAYAQQGSLATREPVAARLERFNDLEGATPGERLVLASLAFERSRASESSTEAARYIERALAGNRLQGEQELDVAGTLYLLVLGLLSTDALDVGAACLEGMLSDAEERASIPAQAFVIVHRGWFFLRQGAVGDAEADARTALELLTTYDIPLGTRFALALLVTALIEADQVEAAERELRDSGYADHIPAGMASNALLEARGHLHVAQGRASEGIEDLVQFGRHDELWGAANPLGSRWRSRAALALASIGENDRAAELAADDLQMARRWGAASGVGVALRSVGLVEGGDAGTERLREAVEVLADSPARLEHARALTDLGAALRRGNRRAAARRALHDGLRHADQLGARALAKRARTELRAAGGRSSDPSGDGVQQLTASEHRVAELAAKGLSNPEIAQTLFVTRKTIETHLGQVYRKLDISGRGKLVHALAGSEDDTSP
jgi:DNA-binding CsgD family transcriptional regulator